MELANGPLSLYELKKFLVGPYLEIRICFLIRSIMDLANGMEIRDRDFFRYSEPTNYLPVYSHYASKSKS